MMKAHTSLQVSDLSKTETFYTWFFNQAPAKKRDGYLKYVLEDHWTLSFVEGKPSPSFGHLGRIVEDAASLAELRAYMQHEMAKNEPEANCCYARQDKFWVSDPDGYEWEIYLYLEDSDQLISDACCVVQSEDSKGACECSAKVAKPTEETACC